VGGTRQEREKNTVWDLIQSRSIIDSSLKGTRGGVEDSGIKLLVKRPRIRRKGKKGSKTLENLLRHHEGRRGKGSRKENN